MNSKTIHKLFVSLCFTGVLASEVLAAEGNLLKNGTFEDGTTSGWSMFLPNDSKDSGCAVGVVEGKAQQQQFFAVLDSDRPARFALNQVVPITPGERYRISAWVKAGDNATLKESLPGAYLRALFLTGEKKDSKADFFQLGLSGKVIGRAGKPNELGTGAIPNQWTKLEMTVETPSDAAYMVLSLFSHGVTGRVQWDSAVVESVPKTTPLGGSSNQ